MEDHTAKEIEQGDFTSPDMIRPEHLSLYY